MFTDGPDGGRGGKFVIYLVATLIPDWQPTRPDRRKAVSTEAVTALREARASGKPLRMLARDIGVSHETVRAAMKRV